MQVLNGAALVLFQEDFTKHDVHWAMIFLGIIAISLLAAAASLVGATIYGYKLFMRVDSIAKTVEQRTGPILDRTNELLQDLGPKIHTVSTNVEQISYTVRAKVDELGATIGQLNDTVQDINGRTRVQVSRVDGIVSDALYATAEISGVVQEGIRAPVRQIAGVIAGLRAGIATLVERSPFGKG